MQRYPGANWKKTEVAAPEAPLAYRISLGGVDGTALLGGVMVKYVEAARG